jgi:hypothetical protein
MMTSSSSPWVRARRVVPALLAIAVVLHAHPAAAQTGSGTVSFGFIRFGGPIALADPTNVNNPATWSPYGTVNGVTPGMDYHYPVGAGIEEVHGSRNFFVPGSTPTGTRNVSLVEHPCCGQPAAEENLFSFAPRPFTNVAVGQSFVLGTLTFKNGVWFGNDTPGIDRKTHLEFRAVTTSSSGAQFNQTLFGTVTMTVHAIDRSLCTTQAGRDAEADWITVDGATSSITGAFRVYDDYCRPPGFTNVGSVDIVARFNSLDLVGFANPQGGFVTTSMVALPTPAPQATVPEPATWALVSGGLAGLAVLGRRRRA